MTALGSNFHRQFHPRNSQVFRCKWTYENTNNHGSGCITNFHQKEIVVPHSIGVILTVRNSGTGLQVKTIKLSYQIWNVLGATQWLVVKEGRNVSCFSLLGLATTLGISELFIFLFKEKKKFYVPPKADNLNSLTLSSFVCCIQSFYF